MRREERRGGKREERSGEEEKESVRPDLIRSDLSLLDEIDVTNIHIFYDIFALSSFGTYILK